MSVFLLLLMVIPSTFAIDEDISIQTNDTSSIDVEASQGDDILEAGSDIYFDASVEKDNGDGSVTSPYKYLTSSRIRQNSNIHLAVGEYNLDKRVSIYGVTIIGSDAEKTIINYDGYAFNVQGAFTLTGVTLNGINILNKGDITAQNTIFANGKGYTADSYGNNFGGSIYTPYESDYYGYGSSYSLDLTNCTFINNTAEYGGAIYMEGGYLTVTDSTFINNTAFNYGGALALEYNQRTIISKSKFKNDRSTNDAGGAIYLRESPMTGDELNFTDCYATFGAGITSLQSSMTLKSVYGENNTAKYNGGVIFHMYGSFSLVSSSFKNNFAHNGGALFIDNSTSFTLMTTSFTDNRAEYCAGAVYSILNNLKRGNSIKDSININTFENNSAVFKDDEYEVSKVEITIGDGNYTMFKVNDTEISSIPSYYSLLDYELVSPVKDQQTSGNCWAYTAIATLESCILKASGECYDLSEEHMKNIIELYSDYGWAMDTNGGGYDEMPIGYFVSWLGPVNETDDLTDDKSTLSPVLNSLMHVQNVAYLGRNTYTDNNAIKEAIMKYGAVATGIYYDDGYRNGASYYYYGSTAYGNHAVTIVGWDDNYSKNKFYGSPQGNGAWIVKNSWGPEWGSNGYFYVSYYDTVFAKVGQSDASYTFILNDTIKLDKNYQYDIAGKTDYFMNSSSEVWYKNVFTSTSSELLAAVSTYFEKITDWDVSVYVNNVLKTTKSGVSNPGYYTINLDDLIPLTLGDVFEVVFHISVNGEAGFPISEKVSLNKVIYDEGVSFVSYDGTNWSDLYDLKWTYSSHSYSSQVACIKAFTVQKGIETATSINITHGQYNTVNITASIIDQYGKAVTNGNVTFSINGEDYVLNVTDGAATLIHNLDKKENEIAAVFNGIGYENSQNATSVEIPLTNVDLSLDIFKNLNIVIINVSAVQKINAVVLANINDDEYNITLTDGKGSLKLEELDKGSYDVKVSITNTEIFNSTTKEDSFTIDVITTKIQSQDLITDDFSGETFSITLTNKSGDAIANMDIQFILNGETYNTTTDDNGIASIPISLAGGEYTITTIYGGEGEYLQSEAQNTIKVKDKVNIDLSIAQNINNAVITVELSKAINEVVNVSVNGKEYMLHAVNGTASLTLNNLENDDYEIAANLVNTQDYIANETSSTLKINVTELNIILTPMKTSDYSSELYTATLTDENNKAVAGKDVEFYLNGKTYQATSDENGTAYIPINLASGDYDISVYFNGDNDFFKTTNKSIINVKDKVEIEISVSQNIKNAIITFKLSKPIDEAISVNVNGNYYTVKAYNGRAVLSLTNLENNNYEVTAKLFNEEKYITNQTTGNFIINITPANIQSSDMNTTDFSSDEYTITLVDINNEAIAGRKVTFLLNGITYTRTTSSNGTSSIPVSLAVGSYDVTISFAADNDYLQTTATNKITVVEGTKAEIVASDFTTYYQSGSQYTILLINNNKAEVGKTVTFSLNGVIYREITDSNGTASININLDVGTYSVTVISDDDVKTQKITVINTISGNKDITSYYKGATYKVRVWTDNGKAVGAGEIVNMTLNGKTYQVKTDANGYASLNINLSPKTYTITATYKGFKVSNKVTIKPTVITKNISQKKAATVKFTAKIVNSKGKVVKNKKVTFKVKGKTYNVKTNTKGIATLSLKNLKVGKYVVYSSYGGLKVKNTITIKK